MDKCPQCNQDANLSLDNPFRPFCSEKCKLIDFGEWANEFHVISRPLELDDLD
ncbi:MAG: DNA gyrase inhibitor YacG [Gammaproteobacteria bacterium]